MMMGAEVMTAEQAEREYALPVVAHWKQGGELWLTFEAEQTQEEVEGFRAAFRRMIEKERPAPEEEPEEPESWDAIFEALARAQARFETVKRSKTAQIRSEKGSYSYSYASLDDVLAAALPALNAEGIAFTQDVQIADGLVQVSTYLSRRQQRIEFGPLELPAAGGTPQGVGSAITYARRYAAQTALGIAAEEDDDARTAEPQAARASSGSKAKPTKAQRAIIARLVADKGQSRQNVLDWLGRHIGIESEEELDRAGASLLIDALRELPDAP